MASQNKNMIPNSKTQLDAAKTDVGVERGAFIQLERTIDAKVEEMKQIDATILETSEEIARLEEQKAKARNDLIGLQSKVANMIDEIRSDDLTAR
jgi:septation ring formation regulator EzrA